MVRNKDIMKSNIESLKTLTSSRKSEHELKNLLNNPQSKDPNMFKMQKIVVNSKRTQAERYNKVLDK